jgi:hypothetical protein
MTALILIIMVISVALAMNTALIVALAIKDCGFAEFMRIPNTSFVQIVLVVILSFNFTICLVFKLLWYVRTSVHENIDPQVLLENGHDHRVCQKKNPSTDATNINDHVLGELKDTIKVLGAGLDPIAEIVRNAVSDASSQQVAELIPAEQFQEPFSAHLQFADFLDAFWGNLFDLHGKLTEKGKIIRLDLLIGLDIEEKFKSCPCCFNGTPEGLCDPFNLVNLSIMKTQPLFKINNSICPEQGNCTLPAVVHLRKCIMDSFLQEDSSLLKSDEVSYFVMENGHVQYEVPIYKKVHSFAESIVMGSNSTSYRPPCPLEELSAMTVLVSKCPSQQVAQQASKTNVYFSYNELKGLLLSSFWACLRNLSDLEQADWLFEHRGGHDEKLVGLAAEMVIFGDVRPIVAFSPNAVVDSDGKMFNVRTSVLGCGDACIWLPSLIISFGVWCISRIFEVLILEQQPVLLGEYSRVLNRLQVKFIFCLLLFFLKKSLSNASILLVFMHHKKQSCNLVVTMP